MFSVHWVARDKETEPVLIEEGFLTSLDKVASACKRRISVLRSDNPGAPPDGFIVLDSDGTVVHRWFEPLEPSA
jgi:hypothetical protein